MPLVRFDPGPPASFVILWSAHEEEHLRVLLRSVENEERLQLFLAAHATHPWWTRQHEQELAALAREHAFKKTDA